MTDQILMLYIVGEVANVLAPVLFYWVALRCIFIWKVRISNQLYMQRLLRLLLPKSSDSSVVTVREAEKAQVLVPLLLWMEYSYIVVFTAMTIPTLYMVTTDASAVGQRLLGFSIVFFLWQRYVMLWLYGRTEYDSGKTYRAFILVWGFCLAAILPANALWTYRLGHIKEGDVTLTIAVLAFLLAMCIYIGGIMVIDYCFQISAGVDEVDPPYSEVIDAKEASWWNLNPIYVLKKRYCPDVPGFEAHEDDVQCWPSSWNTHGFLELGKEYRHKEYKRQGSQLF